MSFKNAIVEVPVEKIVPDPENLRKVFDEDDLRALADNIREHGQMDPIQVFLTADGRFDLLDGERRWRASKLAGLATLRAIIVPRPSHADLVCKKVSRFMQTKTLSYSEEVKALEEGLRALGVENNPDKWAAAARKLGIKPSLLQERMRITRLAPEIRQDFESGKTDYYLAQALGKITDVKLQRKVAEFTSKEELSTRFSVMKFIPKVLESPSQPLIQTYDLAKHEERYRYAKPRKKEEVPLRVEEKIDDMLSDLRVAARWMEAAGKQDLISHLNAENFNTRRVLTTVRHLNSILTAFLTAYRDRYGEKNKSSHDGAQKLLKSIGHDET